MERPELMHRSPTGALTYISPLAGLAAKLGKDLADVERAANADELRAFIGEAELEQVQAEGARIEQERAAAYREITTRRLKDQTALAMAEARQSRTLDPLKAQQILELKREPPQ